MNVNILLIILGVIALWRFVDGYKNGMVKEMISTITLIILALATVFISKIISSYISKQIISMVLAVFMLLLLSLGHSALRLVFFSAKLISKLPVVSFINRLLGSVFGLIEALLFVWVIYTLNMYMDLGIIGDAVILYTKDSAILTYIYERNYLAYEAARILPRLGFVEKLSKGGL